MFFVTRKIKAVFGFVIQLTLFRFIVTAQMFCIDLDLPQ